jgi:hypothetical protein
MVSLKRVTSVFKLMRVLLECTPLHEEKPMRSIIVLMEVG